MATPMSMFKLLRFTAVLALLAAFAPTNSYAQLPDFSFLDNNSPSPKEKKVEPVKKAAPAPAPAVVKPPAAKPAPVVKKQEASVAKPAPAPATKPASVKPASVKPANTRTQTAAQAPCINCAQEAAPKNSNQQDIAKFLEQTSAKVQKPATQAKSSVDTCYTCNKVDAENLQLAQEASAAQKLSLKDFPQIEAYSNSKEVKDLIRRIENGAEPASTGFCYRYVKRALYRSEMVKKELTGNYVFPEKRKDGIGPNALNDLKSAGFTNLLEKKEFSNIIKDPMSAPKGAVLVYTGGYSGGHIEIKTGAGPSGRYISDFGNNNPIPLTDTGRRAARDKKAYKLVGVMIKLPENL